MRTIVKRKKPWPPVDSKLIVRDRFLWVPVCTENTATGQLERRWLERASYLAKVVYWRNAVTKITTEWTTEPIEWLDTQSQIAGANREHERDLERYMEWVRL